MLALDEVDLLHELLGHATNLKFWVSEPHLSRISYRFVVDHFFQWKVTEELLRASFLCTGILVGTCTLFLFLKPDLVLRNLLGILNKVSYSIENILVKRDL